VNRLQVRLFVGIHILAVVLIYAAALWVGGHQVSEPLPTPSALKPDKHMATSTRQAIAQADTPALAHSPGADTQAPAARQQADQAWVRVADLAPPWADR